MSPRRCAASPRDRAEWTDDAKASIGSRRSTSRVDPAWLASPPNVNSHRPCGQIDDATATGASTRSSARPCSTCSSTNTPTRSARCGSAPRCSGVAADSNKCFRQRDSVDVAQSARPVGDPARRSTAAIRRTQRRSARLPRRRMRRPRPGWRAPPRVRRNMSMAANAETTPSGPSNAPPSGTESRCEPVTNAPRGSPDQPGGIHHAHMLPLRSTSTSIPRCCGAPGEPFPQRQIGFRPSEPAIATGARVAADVEDGRATACRTPSHALLHRNPDSALMRHLRRRARSRRPRAG